MAEYVGALDQGTTSTRFMIFDHGGQVVGVDQKEHEQIFPKPGWVEHDPAEIWTRSQEVIPGALAKASLSAGDIAAIGITNQRETTVVWDRSTGQAIHNALVWQDTRTDQICNELIADGGQDRFREKTGLPIATYFSGPKVRWILDNVEGARARADAGELAFGNIDTWCIWNLTGGVDGGQHVTDVTNASRTMLMNLETLDWDDDLLNSIGVPRSMLPEIRSSSQVYGEAVGAAAGVPVAGDLGDQQAALFGQTCFDVGEAKNTYGTGSFLLLNTGTEAVPSKNGLITGVGYKIGDQPAAYMLEGSIAITGALVQWLRDNLKMIDGLTRRRGARADRRGQRRRLLRARVLGSVRALLAQRGSRRDRGPHPLRQRRAHRTGHARGHRVAEPRGGRRDERRLRRRAHLAEGRRRHGVQRPADADTGRRPRRAGDPSRRWPRPRHSAPPTRPASRRGSGARSTTCAATGARTRSGHPSWTRPSARRSTRCGRRP